MLAACSDDAVGLFAVITPLVDNADRGRCSCKGAWVTAPPAETEPIEAETAVRLPLSTDVAEMIAAVMAFADRDVIDTAPAVGLFTMCTACRREHRSRLQ